MADLDELWDQISGAIRNEQIGYARYLCEVYLQKKAGLLVRSVRYADQLIYLGQFAAAHEALDRVEASFSGDDMISGTRIRLLWSQRGHVLRAEGRFREAEEWYLRAHELEPQLVTGLIFAGSAAFKQGATERAIQFARQATHCSDGPIEEAYYNLGGYLLSQRQYEEADACYRKALEIDPDYEAAKKQIEDVGLILQHRATVSPEVS